MGNDFSGRWLSTYEYFSSSRGDTFTNVHPVVIEQDGPSLSVISTSDTGSALSMELRIKGGVISGTWAEITTPGSYYDGREFDGLVMFTLTADQRRLTGQWLGVGGDNEVNAGPWVLTKHPGTPTLE